MISVRSLHFTCWASNFAAAQISCFFSTCTLPIISIVIIWVILWLILGCCLRKLFLPFQHHQLVLSFLFRPLLLDYPGIFLAFSIGKYCRWARFPLSPQWVEKLTTLVKEYSGGLEFLVNCYLLVWIEWLGYFFDREDGIFVTIDASLHVDRLVQQCAILNASSFFRLLRLSWIHCVVPFVLSLVKFELYLLIFCLFLIENGFWMYSRLSLPNVGFLGSVRCGSSRDIILMMT